MLVFEAIGEELSRRGVKAVFSVAASETLRVLAVATQHGIKNYGARHEQAAVGMADGYFRATGEVGVVVVGRGPGLTNGVNAMINATKGKSGVLVIAGEISNAHAADPESASRQVMSAKTIDQPAFLRSFGAVPVTISSAESAVADFGAAFELAHSGRTVAVLFRADVLGAEAGDAEMTVDLPAPASYGEPIAADPQDVELVADLLGETWAAKRPLIIAGRGAVNAGAQEELLRLGDLTGALFATSLLGRPLFAGSPYDVGVMGTMGTPVATELIARSDLVLAFGASLNLFTTYGGELLREARVVQVDADPAEVGAYYPVDIGIAADARVTAKQLADELERRGHHSTGNRTPEVAGMIADERIEDLVRDQSKPGLLDPRTTLIELNKVLPEEHAVVVDGGAVLAWIAQYLTTADAESYFFPNNYFTLAAGVGVALGIAVARPDRPTVLGLGDGGYMMTVNDLDTAVRYKLPVVYIILNDNGFGQEAYQLQMYGLPDDIARYDNPSLVEIARAMGAEAFRLETLDDVVRVGELIVNMDGPLVIECPITQDVRPDATDFVQRYGHRTDQAVASAG
jgi:thiamine pyrophosphate-dependent acetolactate synthase large subunit-like protein